MFVGIVSALVLLVQRASSYTFTMAIIVPLTGPRRMGIMDVRAAVNITIAKLSSDPALRALKEAGHDFDFIVRDSKCDRGSGLYEFAEMVTHQMKAGSHKIHVVIGPSCDDVCESVGLLASRWHLPVISFGCWSDTLSNRNDFATLLRTTGSFGEIGIFVRNIMKYYKWNRVTLVTGPQAAWLSAVVNISIDFRNYGIYPRRLTLDNIKLNETLAKEAKDSRVFVLCAYGQDIIHFMLTAFHLGMMNGEYSFLSIDYANMAKIFPETYHSTVPISQVFGGMLDITFDVRPEKPEFVKFMKEMDGYKRTNNTDYENGIRVALVVDAIYLYVLALNNCVRGGGLCPLGKDIADYLYGSTEEGVTGSLAVDLDGSRHASYMLHSMLGDKYTPVARTKEGGVGFELVTSDVPQRWPGGGTEVPLGKPKCGWKNELCQHDIIPVLTTSIVSALFVAGVLSLLVYYLYSRKMKQMLMYRDDWKIKPEQIVAVNSHISLHSSKQSQSAAGSKASSLSGRHSVNGGKVAAIPHLAMFDTQLVMAKPIRITNIVVTKEIVAEINSIRFLVHPNVNSLLGAVVEPGKNMLIWTRCSRGSLQDVLLNDDIKLDWIFKVSFVSDIAEGMSYIHNSIVGFHGALKSTNVFVNNLWVCKVGDLKMPIIRDGENHKDGETSHYFKYLWMAPELLRGLQLDSKGLRMADVYAFGIILEEIATRNWPYNNILHECDNDEAIQGILEKLKNVQIPAFRPDVPQIHLGEPLVGEIMRLCWHELPSSRPTFDNILVLLKKIKKGKYINKNILDHVIHMMSKYSDHLEEIVEERTCKLMEEKKRSEEVLSWLLPKSVAENLKIGKVVEPELFASVTVFFSDIIGFTQLAAESSPRQVVTLLNNLYTLFDMIINKYDVYKVETIGDAYMVVSGLPARNGIFHAGEICTMALHLLSSMVNFKISHRPNKELQLRIGIHSGPVVAGVVGHTMPRYCLFGETVTHASNMEASGFALRIHISHECKLLLDELGGYHCVLKGEIVFHGQGTCMTYFLFGKDGFIEPLPSPYFATDTKKE